MVRNTNLLYGLSQSTPSLDCQNMAEDIAILFSEKIVADDLIAAINSSVGGLNDNNNELANIPATLGYNKKPKHHAYPRNVTGKALFRRFRN